MRSRISRLFLLERPFTNGANTAYTLVPFRHTYVMFLSSYWGEPYWTMGH